MEELLNKFLSKATESAVQAGIVSLATDVDFKDAFKTIGGLNLASSVVGGNSPLDFFNNKQAASGPTGQASGIDTSALQGSKALTPSQLIQKSLNPAQGKVPFSLEYSNTAANIRNQLGGQDTPSVSQTNLSKVQNAEPDTRGIMSALGDVITGDGGRGNALKQLFMPDPEGDPDPFRRFAPALLAAIAAGKMGGAFDPVQQQQQQQFGGITGQGLLNQNPGYRIGVPTLARGYAQGGDIDPSTFPRRTGAINGPGTGTSDDIPAMLSNGEFVMTEQAVRAAGNGDHDAGVRNMYQMMNGLESRMA
tara:strand:+ start:120 stop:1037 length:918 start_codon:yes stop_codon:yes gene_type:complete